MNPVAALLAPWMLLLPAAGAIEQMASGPATTQPPLSPPDADQRGGLTRLPPPMTGFENAERMAWEMLVGSFRDDRQQQVRIEQHVIIRITPRAPTANPNFLFDLPNREVGPRFEERRMGRCLPVAGIAGVQVSGDNKLILFMRDHRIISAGLERACRARDFYSGFLVQRSDDGMLCMGRDKLQSRAGANCAVDRLRQLVEVDD